MMIKTIGNNVAGDKWQLSLTQECEKHLLFSTGSRAIIGIAYWILKQRKNFENGRMDRDDSFQTAILGILKGIRDWNKDGSASVSTLAFRYGKQEFWNARRNRLRTFFVLGNGKLSFLELWEQLPKSKQKSYNLSELRSQGIEYDTTIVPKGGKIFFAQDSIDEIIFEEMPCQEIENHSEIIEFVNHLMVESGLTPLEGVCVSLRMRNLTLDEIAVHPLVEGMGGPYSKVWIGKICEKGLEKLAKLADAELAHA